MVQQACFEIERLRPGDAARIAALNDLFAVVFEEPETYRGARPDASYLEGLLADPGFIALVAVQEGELIGGLVAYVLRKFEQQRSELYLYDLGVAQAHRRRGVASALIQTLRPLARALGAWTIWVQADAEDTGAVALYTRFGPPQDVRHFDIAPDEAPGDPQ